MKKIVWSFLLFLLLAGGARSQQYGNEWIDYSRTHFKIKVWNDGIYRIPYSTLAAAIPNISSINPANLVMYHNGQQVPIYISSQTSIGPGDYIEFFGVQNRGEIDSLLYVPRSAQPHPFMSLFSDTSIYFLTTSATQNNRRLVNIPNDLSNLPPKENFFIHVSRRVFLNGFFEGKVYYAGQDELSKSLFEEGEGWSSGWVNSSPRDSTFNIPTPALYSGPGGPGFANFKFYHLSRSNTPHILTVKVNGQVVYNTSYVGWRQNRFEQPISLGLINSGSTPVSFRFSDNSPGLQQNRLQLIEIAYPRAFDFGGASFFRFPLSAGGTRKFLDISNFNDQGSSLILLDITNGFRITSPAGNSKFVLPPSLLDRELVLGCESQINLVSVITPIDFKNYSALDNQGNFVIISHPSLGVNSPNSQVEEYRKFRDINGGFGGKYLAVTVDIEQLYDQFAYGINKHPLAIVNFIQYAVNNWAANRRPQYVLLLGKAREYPDMRFSVAARNQCLIPTFGYPGSDVLLSCPIGSNIPSVAIGRVAVQTPDDIKVYLDKLKTYESLQSQYSPDQNIPDKEWMKQVLHFSGGTSLIEQNQLTGYVNNWKRIIEDTSYGARVTTFSKSSPAPVDQAQQQVVKSIINKGISLLTFFGHSSAALGFDVSIDEPNNYTNYNRYPVIISNGCLVGLIHSAGRNYSERFVIPRAGEGYQGLNTGAIAFLATTGMSLSSSLNTYTTRVYNNLARVSYTKPFADIIRQTMVDLNSCCSGDNFTMMVAYEFTLHGDPALTLNQYDKPDYAIDNSSLYFNPPNITAAADTFEAKLIVTNLGKALPNTIRATLYRRVRDPQNPSNFIDLVYHQPLSNNYFKDTITFKVPTLIPYGNSYIGYGANEFGAFVESEEKVNEMAELNNRIPLGAIVTNIQSDDIIPIYPYEFAIVPKQGVTLKASTVNPFAPYRTYRFEIDTTELFNSPKLISGTVSQTGGVVKFIPNLIMEDSVVYYWRVGVDSGGTGKNWHYSSFIYLKDEYPGWNQSHHYQYIKDKFHLLSYGSDRVFRFSKTANQIDVNAGGGDPLAVNWTYNGVLMHNGRFINKVGYTNGLVFAVIDSATGKPWSSINYGPTSYGKFGNIHVQPGYAVEQFGFDFRTANQNHPIFTNKTWAQVISDFIDSIPNGNYVLVYTINWQAQNYTTWDTVLVNALVNKLGATVFQQLKNDAISAPYIYFTQKGNFNFPALSKLGNAPSTSKVSASTTFIGTWFEGYMTSTLIGPAREWGSFHWQKRSLENPSTDEDTVYIYGINSSNQKVLLLQTIQPDNSIQNIDAGMYPYLQLELKARDFAERTPMQLGYWRVLYKEVPEAALNPSAHFVFTDSLLLGSNVNLEIAVENVTEYPMDSLVTKYILRDALLTPYTYFIKQDSLRGFQTMILRLNTPVSGNNYKGINRIYIETNPLGPLHQPEQYHFNNIAEVSFTTGGDNINPLLDVTFDGRHIVNGEIVSAKPHIVINLKDENKFLALDDTSLITVFIKYPNESTPRRFAYDNNIMTFYPANPGRLAQDNTARVELKPIFTQDGRYTLFVSDRDRSGNQSSSNPQRYEGNILYDYKTDFEVVTKTTITNVLNYPNPFTTSTRFVFTLTGSEIPDYMKIQIMTLKGTVVKEIHRDELGPIRIGNNITEYAWDGRDQYGDLLANGVYFYRVITKMNAETVEHRSESFDKYFKKGFGKMVLIR
jgi:hypothetical protein